MRLLLDVPVDPTAPEARQWVIDELSKPEYQAAKPTWLDLAAEAVQNWLAGLVLPSGGDFGGVLPVLAAVVVVALIIVAFILFGRPRRNRSAVARLDALFGSDDRRSSAQLRSSAAAAARSGDYRTAIEELYRALARRQSERTVLRVDPGTTAQEFAVRAAQSYPPESGRLAAAARVFDEVRYLGAPGSREQYDALEGLEAAIRDAAPARREPVAAAGSR
ncbi:DUF4129 domain-containing protein [Subtercola boreus]|uniref:Protein-glutamine gamma-glutamyltransferase-like C-terminal domain-containing protein n=1 Tax=Subtercola boreus TaxID=120213 RepID=A0A3E0WF57_9MICO|nr:DUF4129 domain-containing protein [Subtercola boreus]RFA22668.1 hypothetical protein B7R24_03375 [Subtercola boreus]RFA23023.1 hypothetical protein B7R23_03370 [Subtercola boreus]RFA28775.1 hypothetical protein B7R25_03385 [Subtercola boreus]